MLKAFLPCWFILKQYKISREKTGNSLVKKKNYFPFFVKVSLNAIKGICKMHPGRCFALRITNISISSRNNSSEHSPGNGMENT